jgi:pimeloyl-ACP methyl ester carboxylesterase
VQRPKPEATLRAAMQCELRSLSIHYESRGEGRPLLVLHGSPGDAVRARERVDPAFRRRTGWQRIYPDLPGHGRTPGTDRVRDIDDYLAVLLEFVDTQFRGRRFSLGGISFGAYLALGVARKRSPRIDGLLLSAPEVNFSAREDRRERGEGGPFDPAPEEAARSWKGYAEDTAWLQRLAWHDLSLNLYRRGRRFPAPTLLLFGRQDATFRYRDYAKLLPDFPRATFAVLDGAGHDLWRDQRELTGALVREWLTRVESWTKRGRPSK